MTLRLFQRRNLEVSNDVRESNTEKRRRNSKRKESQGTQEGHNVGVQGVSRRRSINLKSKSSGLPLKSKERWGSHWVRKKHYKFKVLIFYY